MYLWKHGEVLVTVGNEFNSIMCADSASHDYIQPLDILSSSNKVNQKRKSLIMSPKKLRLQPVDYGRESAVGPV